MTQHQKVSKQHAILQRRLRVAQLAAQGRTQQEIALELGVSQPTICADLNEIHAQWRQATAAESADRIAREIAMIEEVRRAAWQGWARSQQDAERERVKTTVKADESSADADMSQTRTEEDGGVRVERTKERRTQSGDSKLLQIALNCSEMILRTLGAFKTKPTPPVNTWDTVLKTLYQAQENGDAEDDATRIQEPGTRGQGPGAREKPAGAEAKAEEVDIPPKPSDADLEPGEEWVLVEEEVDDDEEAAEEASARGEGRGAREENAQTPTSPAPVSDAEPGARGRCSSRQAGGLPHGHETPTSAVPVSDPEPGAQVPPGTEEPPKALAADDPEECWLTARRGWHRVANISIGGLANPWPLGRRP
jgi:predicted transcriptional regulator